jgi:hypothetical protein
LHAPTWQESGTWKKKQSLALPTHAPSWHVALMRHRSSVAHGVSFGFGSSAHPGDPFTSVHVTVWHASGVTPQSFCAPP